MKYLIWFALLICMSASATESIKIKSIKTILGLRMVTLTVDGVDIQFSLPNDANTVEAVRAVCNAKAAAARTDRSAHVSDINDLVGEDL